MKVKLKNQNIFDNYTETILHTRGIKDVENFIQPNFKDLEDWRHLKNIEKASVIVLKAIEDNEKIGMIVDCDVDGYTSAAILFQYLKLNGVNNITYFLHTAKQHGLEDTFEEIQKRDFDLIIIPDASSNDGYYIEQLNCPVIVLDHHILEKDSIIPSNMILVNNQTSDSYTNKDLSGAGVVFQFCRALDVYLGEENSKNFMDLAALGICADMMSGLSIENQYIWKMGFSKLHNFFFKVLADKQRYSITGKVGASDEELIEALNPTSVAFYIVPLINAMIRVGTQDEKDRLFRAFIDGESMVVSHKRGANGALEKVAIESARECTNAKNHQDKEKKAVVDKLEQKIFKYDLLENKILFIRLDDDDDFPSVLNGLVAMQLSAKYKKPTIVARLNDEGYIRGSARGLNESELISFKDFLNDSNLFEYTAGHNNAFGISIPNDKLDNLHKYANKALENIDFGEDYYEVEIMRNSYDKDILNIITDISNYKNIWSQKNEEPLIYIKNITLSINDIQIMGRNKDTIKFIVNDVTYIKFFAKDFIEDIEGKEVFTLEVVGKANMNEYMGRFIPQIQIKSYEIQKEEVYTPEEIADLCTF